MRLVNNCFLFTQDLERDLEKFTDWLNRTEDFVNNLTLDRLWDASNIEIFLKNHQV